MILSILCLSLGIVLGAAIVTFRKQPHDDSTSAAQQLDFLDAHKLSLFYNTNLEEWGVLDQGRAVIGYSTVLRLAVEAARRKLEADVGVQLEQVA